jgi:hypothetical protein
MFGFVATAAVRGGPADASLAKFASSAHEPAGLEAAILDSLVPKVRRCPTVLVVADADEADSATVEFLVRADEAGVPRVPGQSSGDPLTLATIALARGSRQILVT